MVEEGEDWQLYKRQNNDQMEKQPSAIIYRWYDHIKTREMRSLHLVVSRLPSLAVHSSDFTSQLCCIQIQPERNEGRRDLAVLFHKLHWGVSGLPIWEQRQCQYIHRETGFAAKTLSQKKFIITWDYQNKMSFQQQQLYCTPRGMTK